MKTMLSVKTDAKLKKKAQDVARDLGLPLGTIINRYLKDFVAHQRIVFERPEIPNAETREAIEDTLRDLKTGENMIAFKSAKEMDKYLLSL
ncbi:MAG: type II toxin-antitoxin system RelB/DinJ family antitoxin [Minisyncoccia bacterium]